jgi:Bifunctional DNA primase/polymerase, N-terminal
LADGMTDEQKNWSVNDYADFWRYEAGLNVIPADTRNKRPKVEWKQFQHKAIPVELHNFWIKEDMFKDGMMIIAGQVWHNERKKGLFLNCIDLDNELAIQEFCKINGQQMALNVVADTGHFIIEQHVDDPTRAHILVWSDKRPFKKKISNLGDNVPRIEVKGEGNDSLVSVTPSPHTNGSNYEFVGDWHLAVIEPKIHNQIEEHINTICENYGIEYLNGDANANKNYNPVLRNQGPIRKGERHNRILSYTNSLIIRNHKTTNKDTIYEYLKVYNNNPKEVEEPLEESELKQIFNDAWDNITTKSTSSIQEQKQQESETDNDSDNEPMTYEDWNKTVMEKYENLKNVSDENLQGLWYSLEFELSVFKILNIKDCTLPFAGILLGAPSSLKTVGIELFRKVPNTFYTDNFSARAIVSHSTTVQKDKLEEIDMLPRMKNKFFLTPELSPIFGKKDDDLQETLSIITRVLDGHGYESDTGAHGHGVILRILCLLG